MSAYTKTYREWQGCKKQWMDFFCDMTWQTPFLDESPSSPPQPGKGYTITISYKWHLYYKRRVYMKKFRFPFQIMPLLSNYFDCVHTCFVETSLSYKALPKKATFVTRWNSSGSVTHDMLISISVPPHRSILSCNIDTTLEFEAFHFKKVDKEYMDIAYMAVFQKLFLIVISSTWHGPDWHVHGKWSLTWNNILWSPYMKCSSIFHSQILHMKRWLDSLIWQR